MGGEGKHMSERDHLLPITQQTKASSRKGKGMSLTDGLPHIFRRRLLEKKVELLDELDAAPYTPPARNSFEEGSVLFEDTDGDFDGDFDATASRSLLGASTVSGATHSDVAQLTRKPTTLFPPEPGLPAEAKDLKWLRILGSCIVVMRWVLNPPPLPTQPPTL